MASVFATLFFMETRSLARTVVVPVCLASISVVPAATPVMVSVWGEPVAVAGDTVALLVSALSNVTLPTPEAGVTSTLATGGFRSSSHYSIGSDRVIIS